MKLYHGSPTPIKQFDIRKGAGRFGNALYLTPKLDTAKFYAKNGRQGKSGQSLNTSPGYLYEFDVEGNFYQVDNLEEFLKELLEMEEAEETFQQWGILDKVEKFSAQWALEKNYDGIDFSKVEQGVHQPLPQVIVVNKKAIKSARPVKMDLKVEGATDLNMSEIREIMAKIHGEMFKGKDSFPLPRIKFTDKKGSFGSHQTQVLFNENLNKVVVKDIWMELSKKILDSREMLEKVISHELIHFWEFYHSEPYKRLMESKSIWQMKDNIAYIRNDGHGSNFLKWMEKFNAKYGKGFVNVQETYDYAEDKIKPYYLIIRPSKTEGYSFAIARTLTAKAKHYIEQYMKNYDARVFKTQAKEFHDVSKTIGDGSFYLPSNAEEKKILKDLYTKGDQVTTSAMVCDEEEMQKFVTEFILKFKAKMSTLKGIMRNYEKPLDVSTILKPFFTELHKQLLLNFGSCDELLKETLKQIGSPKVFSSVFKPKQDQYLVAIKNWFDYLREMTRSLERNHEWLNGADLLASIDACEKELPS